MSITSEKQNAIDSANTTVADPESASVGSRKSIDMWDRRFLLTFAVSLLGIIAIVALRPQKEFGLIESKFAAAKLEPSKSFDVVAVGDSRVLHAIDPVSFASQRDGLTAHNFGFQGAALSPSIMSAASELLDQDGETILLCGVTPNNFTPDANATNGFIKLGDLLKKRSVFHVSPSPVDYVARKLEPVAMRDLAQYLRGDFKSGIYKTYHPTGWVEVRVQGKGKPKAAFPLYRRRFVNNQPDADNIEAFLESVSRAVGKGVKVVGFQPPVPDEMLAIEREESGFDYDQFINKFEAAGGIWMKDLSDNSIKTYDGSHLDESSARRFSKAIGEAVSAQLAISNSQRRNDLTMESGE